MRKTILIFIIICWNVCTFTQINIPDKHNGMREQGKMEINFYPEKESVFIKIEDNGKGFDTSKSNEAFGLKLRQERMQLLNQTNKDQLIALHIKSEEGEGTIVLLSLKNHF